MKFVIAYLSFFTNEIVIEFIESESLLEAYKLAYKKAVGVDYHKIGDENVDSIQQAAFNCDTAIGVKAF